MSDMISRAAALDAIDGMKPINMEQLAVKAFCWAAVKSIPAVDAAPVVHGRWIDENPDDSLDPRMRCSICTGVETPLIKWRYCPNCGAKMDKEG